MQSLLDAYKNEVLNKKRFMNAKLTPRNNKEDYYEGEVKITYRKVRVYPDRPVNEWFEGSHKHHFHKDRIGRVNHGICAYIPRDMHMDNPHDSVSWNGMDNINDLAWKYVDEEKARLNKNIDVIPVGCNADYIDKPFTKKCSHCGKEKTSDHFYLDNKAKYKLTSWCRECCKEKYSGSKNNEEQPVVNQEIAEIIKNNVDYVRTELTKLFQNLIQSLAPMY